MVIWALLFPILVSAAPQEHKLMKRVVVFPLSVDLEFAAAAEDAWWEIRDLLTRDKRLMVASKNFLTRKEVYQPRKELTPADAIILSKLLDADAILTAYLENRRLFMTVYESEFGRLLWRQSLELHPSVAIRDQMVEASKKLTLDFLSSFPYQGHVIVDGLIGKSLYKDSGQIMSKVLVGSEGGVVAGDAVQFIRVIQKSLSPLFQDGGGIEVFAEGVVKGVQDRMITVQILRANKGMEIGENTLVRFPNEYKRIQDMYSIHQSIAQKLAPNIINKDMVRRQEEVDENKPLYTSLTFIFSAAVFLILAF